MSEPEKVLAGQLRMLKIPHEREYRFAPPRRWRADFAVLYDDWDRFPPMNILIEVEGGIGGTSRHLTYTGFTKDCEKYNAAAILGYRVIRCTPRQVDSGECVAWIERALGVGEKAA